MKSSEESYLVDLFNFFNADPDAVPEGFETDFMIDVGERFAEEGVNMFVSGKMMNVLRRIGNERFGMIWSDYL